MAVTYGFFNSINGDRKYNADQMSDYFRGIVNQGVFQHLDNGLAVSAGTGMEVNVATGRAIVQNKWIQNDMALPLTIEAASDTYGRKDAVVIRLSYTNRNISIVVKTGTPAASPTAPSMTRNSTTYEMALAYVNVAANATSVTVTDKRSDSSVCGWISVAQEASGEVDAMLEAMKTGFDGVVYPTPAAQVIGSDLTLQGEIERHAGFVDIPLYRGTMNTTNGAITKNSSTLNRLVSDITAKSIDTKFVIDADDIQYYIAYYDGSKTFVKAVGWKNSGNNVFEDYPYFALLLSKRDNSNFPDTDIPCYKEFFDLEKMESDISVNADNTELLKNITTSEQTAIDGANREVGTPIALSASYRWFFNEIIPAGSGIISIDAYLKYIDSGAYLEVWKIDGSDIKRVKQIALDLSVYTINTVANIPVNFYCSDDSYVAIAGTTTDFACNNETGASLLMRSSDTDIETDELAISSLGDFGNFWPRVTINYLTRPKDEETLIYVGPGGQFQTIQGAIDSITDDSASKPYTIILMPNATPYGRFSMIRKLSEAYPWNNVTPRYISLIGIDKTRCIVRSDTGNYQTPPAELMNNGIIKNITFVMTHDDQDPEATQGGYCIHIDCRTKDDVGYKMIIEDCDFENNSGPCLGIGMHKNCDLQIIRCRFNTTLLESYAPYPEYRNLYDFGCIFAHTSTQADATNQHITFIDCIGECKEGQNSLWLAMAGSYDPSTADFTYTIIRNVFWNKKQAAAGYAIASGLFADPKNFGNNNA